MRVVAICTLLAAQLLSAQQPPLELVAEVDERYGVRRTYESQYKLLETRSNGKVELWSIRRMESYQRHWVSPYGRVWVIAGHFRARSPSLITKLPPVIWVRDSRGKEIADGFSYALTHRDVPDLHWDKATFRTFKNSLAEQMIVPGEDGIELRCTITYDDNNGEFKNYVTIGRKGVDSLMEKGLSDSSSSFKLFQDAETGFAYAKAYMGEDHFFLPRAHPTLDPLNFRWIQQEIPLPGRPTYIGHLPTGQLLLAVFSDLHNVAELRLWRVADVTSYSTIDLKKLTGMESTREIQKRLNFRDARALVFSEWLPISGLRERGLDQTAIEMWDDLGHRYQIDIKKQGDKLHINAQKSARPQLRRSDEAAYSMREILEEKEVFSPNNLFKLRKRTYAGPETKPVVWTAVLQKKEDYWDELWTQRMDVDLSTSHLLENGTLVMVGMTSHSGSPVVSFHPPDLRQTSTELVRENWYKSNEEALQYFDPSKLVIRAAGKRHYGPHPGEITAYTQYTFNFPLPGGKTGEFYFMYNGWDQSQVWWVEEGLKKE